MPATVEAAVDKLRAVPAPLQGALYMIAAALGFSVMNIAIRSAAEELDPLQIAFFRNFFALLFMLPWLWQVGAAGLRTAHLGLHLWRAAIALGPALELCYWELDDEGSLPPPSDWNMAPLSQAVYDRLVETLRRLYLDAATPELVRRRVLEEFFPIPYLEDWRTRADDCLVFGSSLVGAWSRGDPPAQNAHCSPQPRCRDRGRGRRPRGPCRRGGGSARRSSSRRRAARPLRRGRRGPWRGSS